MTHSFCANVIVEKNAIQNPDDSVRFTRTPKVTGKGQVYFVNKFLGVCKCEKYDPKNDFYD